MTRKYIVTLNGVGKHSIKAETHYDAAIELFRILQNRAVIDKGAYRFTEVNSPERANVCVTGARKTKFYVASLV